MKRVPSAESPEAYVAALTGWRRKCVVGLRASVRASASLDEAIKWGHLVYSANGPVLYIRAEDSRVLFGFWRGKRLRKIEPRLKHSGNYELATVELHDGDALSPNVIRRLTRQAAALDRKLGDPRAVAKRRHSR